MRTFCKRCYGFQLLIICLLTLALFTGEVLALQEDSDIEFEIMTGSLEAGPYFSGSGQVIIPPGRSQALRVEIKADSRYQGEEFLVSFPEETIELLNLGGDLLLATNFNTCLDNNIGRLDSEGRAEFTVGLTINNITADKESGEYKNIQLPLITVKHVTG